MKKSLLLFLLAFTLFCSSSKAILLQTQNNLNSILNKLNKAKDDTNKVNLFIGLFYNYTSLNPDEGLKFVKPALQLCEKLNWNYGLALTKRSIGVLYWKKGDFDMALKFHTEVLKLFEDAGDKYEVAKTYINIGQDYGDGGKYDEAKKYFSLALKLFEEVGNKNELASTYLLFAWVYGNLGNFSESSKNTYLALKIYESLNDKYGVAIASSNIADDYIQLRNYETALKFLYQSCDAMKETDDRENLGGNYNIIGGIYLILGNWNEALQNYQRALKIGNEIPSNNLIADTYSSIGNLYLIRGDYKQALEYLLKSEILFSKISNKQSLAKVYCQIGICYTKLNKFNDAELYFTESYAMSNELKSIVGITEYYKGMEVLDSTMRNWEFAYKNIKYYLTNRDSIYNQENIKKLVQAQMEYASEKKDAEAKAEQEKTDIRQSNIRNSIIAGLVISLVFLLMVYRQRNRISKEKKRSDELLLNILPAETAEELKNTGTTTAKEFALVTVMFTDFKNFTSMSELLTAQDLVNEINYCYSEFDNIITRHGIEKIKTIGDSYMCAGGLPVISNTNAVDTVTAAIEIRDFMLTEKQKRTELGLPYFEIRIGCNTGPVVAGIVGIKKFAYDIWGDTVNIASRMESSGEPGKVNISGSTFELVKEKFTCKYRGKIEAKNKGMIDMYFVE